jgi:Mn-dependent DtxR family transcriptional regulator
VVSAVPLDEGPSRIHAILETGNFRVKDVAKKLGVPEATVRAMIALDGSGLELNAQGWVKSLVEA